MPSFSLIFTPIIQFINYTHAVYRRIKLGSLAGDPDAEEKVSLLLLIN